MNTQVVINEEVKNALANKQAVVALESTIISHGMPYPQNVATALKVEQAVRDAGAIPATIGIIAGRLTAGLSHEEIEHMGKQGEAVMKCSRRDLPFVVAKKKDGATTVASTMIIAQLAGIRFFATGGVGGVHRKATETMDISADLQELAKTNVAVISAGVKSILDIGLTLEYLETMGVPVIGYQTDIFPAFYTRSSNFGVDFSLDDPMEIAALLKAKWELKLDGGALIANPIPKDFSMEPEYINGLIDQAILEAEQKGIKGKALTPFLLSRVESLSKGKSLVSNIELVIANAKLASKIALAYAKL